MKDSLARFPAVFALVFAMCVVPVALHTGCALFSKDAPLEQKLADVRLLAYSAAALGTQEALLQNESWRPQFTKAYENLNRLVNTGVVSGTLLREVIASLPVKELKSPRARLAIDSALYLFDATVGTKLEIEKAPFVNAAAVGLRDGLRSGLGL
jgi:hypothetical protein